MTNMWRQFDLPKKIGRPLKLPSPGSPLLDPHSSVSWSFPLPPERSFGVQKNPSPSPCHSSQCRWSRSQESPSQEVRPHFLLQRLNIDQLMLKGEKRGRQPNQWPFSESKVELQHSQSLCSTPLYNTRVLFFPSSK